MLNRILIVFGLLTMSAWAENQPVYFDCQNYCAFREFDNNCHGIAFEAMQDTTVTAYHYSRWDDKKQGCVYTRFLNNQFVSAAEIASHCECRGLPQIGPLPDKNEPMKDSTAAELRELRDTIRNYVVCAPDPLTMPVPDNDQQPIKPWDQASCAAMKHHGVDAYAFLGGCWKENGPDCGYFGNTNNYFGPLCYTGETDRCNDVIKCQNPETGAWYRSAFQRRFLGSDHGQPTFSRDEFLGVMLYLVKTKDKVAAEKWMRFIANNPKKKMTGLSFLKVFNICPPLPAEKPPGVSDAEWKSMQPDDRCEMRGDSWAAMYKVYRYIGFSKAELKAISPGMYRHMIIYSQIAGLTAYLSAASVPDVGYEQGNQATNIMLLQALGMKNRIAVKEAAKLMDARNAYESPYYHYLALGGVATEYGAYLIKKYCPTSLPNYEHPPQGGVGTPAASYWDFGVHYFGGVAEGWQANLPTGHECVGWINLYLGGE